MRPLDRKERKENNLVSHHKTVSTTTSTCQIVHVLRQQNAKTPSKVDNEKSMVQSGRLLYEKANSPINYFRRAPLFTYHTPNNAAHEGKITPYTSVLGIPEHRLSSRAFRSGSRQRRQSSSPSGKSPTKIPKGMLPVTCYGINMEALEQRRKYNNTKRTFNRHIHRARLESALQNMTYDPEFDAHEYLRDDIAHELRIRSLEVMKHKYCNQDDVYFADYASYYQPVINYKDTATMEDKKIHAITSNLQSFIGQCDNTQYQLRRKEEDTKLYGSGNVHNAKLKQRKQMLVNMLLDDCDDDNEAAEYVAMYGVFNRLRGMDIKHEVKIPHLVNGIYNDMLDLVHLRPAPAFDADSSYDAKDDNEPLTDETCEDPSNYISGLYTRNATKNASQSEELRQHASHSSKSTRRKARSRHHTCSSVHSDKSQMSIRYSHIFPSRQHDYPRTLGRESSPVASKINLCVYPTPSSQQGNYHFTSFAVPNQSTERINGESGDRVANYICTVLEPVAIHEDSIENKSSVWELSGDSIDLTHSAENR